MNEPKHDMYRPVTRTDEFTFRIVLTWIKKIGDGMLIYKDVIIEMYLHIENKGLFLNLI